MEGKIRRILKVKGPLKDWEVKKGVNAHREGLWVYDTAKRNLTHAKEMGSDRKGKRLFLKHE
jgi:hypothetical protein